MKKPVKINPKLVAHREQWLTQATNMIRSSWEPLGVAVPMDVKLTCGFPGGGSPQRRIGECWPRSRSGANVNEVMISPVLADSMIVLDVLGHELIHAADNCASGHGAAFTKASKTVGYSGGKHSKIDSMRGLELVQAIVARLGAYPHAKVELTAKKRNASHGLHKLECGCGNVSYMTAKKVEDFGFPVCGACSEFMVIASERDTKKVVETI
jgi:hypothetical protein